MNGFEAATLDPAKDMLAVIKAQADIQAMAIDAMPHV